MIDASEAIADEVTPAPVEAVPTYDPTYAEQLLGIIMQSHPDVYERAVLIHRVYQLEAENAALKTERANLVPGDI